MSFLDHIARCNPARSATYVPFRACGAVVGAVRRDRLDLLAPHRGCLDVSETGVTLSPALETAEARGAAMAGVARDLADGGHTLRWRDEPYPVGTHFGESLFVLERAAVPFFGVRAHGIHVNGVVAHDGGLAIWTPRRRPDRAVAPDKLDNTVAGGQPAGLSLTENLIKEAAEEASIPAPLARQARPVGVITYRMDVEYGLRNDVLFLYDLALPEDFVPVNHDGEVGDFTLMPAETLFGIVDGTDDFKFNCNLVLIDFFIRHGMLDPDHADYVAIAKGLRS